MDKRVEKRLMELALANSDQEPAEFSFAHEQLLYNVVRSGCVDLIPAAQERIQSSYQQSEDRIRYSDDSVQNEIYKFVNAIVLFSRAAISAGVPEVVAYGLAQSYIYCADKYRTEFFADALTSFTQAVSDYKASGKDQTATAQRIKHYIGENLNSPIRIRDIAEALFLSESYCSHVFKQVEGITIHQYLESMRIQASCSLLKHSDWSIQRISEYFCFSRHSHYSDVFRRRMGMSPSEYREHYLRPDSKVSNSKEDTHTF